MPIIIGKYYKLEGFYPFPKVVRVIGLAGACLMRVELTKSKEIKVTVPYWQLKKLSKIEEILYEEKTN